MKKSMNYITALPDFIEMQRISFCWFISEGLKDELANFSSILDFSGNIEYIFFGQEYKLVKPIYNASNAKRHASNYIAQLIMPIEMRNRQANIIMKRGRLSIANLPLMTTSATFIINGCERIIVSQVIRSPGIYFEKNKKQRRRKLNKLTLSNDFHKVRSFTQTSFGILKNPKVLSSLSMSKKYNFLQNLHTGNLSNNFLSFIEFFRVYGLISKNLRNSSKSQQIENFLKLLRIVNNDDSIINERKNQNYLIVLNDLNNLLKSMIKFQILQTFLTEKRRITNIFPSSLYQSETQLIQLLHKKNFKRIDLLLDQKLLKFKHLTEILRKQFESGNFIHSGELHKLYRNEIDLKYFKLCQYRLKKYSNIINIFESKSKKIIISSTFSVFHSMLKKVERLSFLTIKINRKINSLKKILVIFEESRNLKSVIYFPIIKNYRRSDIIKNKDYFEKKDIYKNKYKEKDLYTATLIPEYGSWVCIHIFTHTNGCHNS